MDSQHFKNRNTFNKCSIKFIRYLHSLQKKLNLPSFLNFFFTDTAPPVVWNINTRF